MTQAEMMVLVPQKLRQIEEEYGVRILYAAESGSRAWGTASPQSDFDVRFIYIRPQRDYLRLEGIRDVLEFPIEEGWDMCGWDIRKMLTLLHNSNSQIYEWFASTVVYVDDGFSKRLRPVLEAFFSVKTAANHYLHQAGLKMKKLQKSEEAKVKHYLYSLQHLASVQWVLTRRKPVAVSLQALLPCLPEEVRGKAEDLLHQKISHQSHVPHDGELDAWLAEEYSRLEERIRQLPKEEEKDWETLNRFFLSELERME